MKAKIKKIIFKKEYETQFGMLYGFEVQYTDETGKDKKAYYSSKKQDQTTFKEGTDADIVEEVKKTDKGEYITIKPVKQAWTGKSGYAKEVKKEQSKYSGFAVAYAKDLCVAGKIDLNEILSYASVLFEHMVSLDKSIQS